MAILSSLALVDMDQLHVHEAHEPARLYRTRQAIQQQGVLRHPVLATPLSNGHYLVIDGAHRTLSLKQLGCYRVPVQIVSENQLLLSAWDHLVPVGPWLQHLRMDPALVWQPHHEGGAPVARLLESTGEVRAIYAVNSAARLPVWHKVVDAYTHNCEVQRVPHESDLRPVSGAVRLRFPICTLDELDALVLNKQLLPPGVTRFVTQGRLLNVCIPMEFLDRQTYSQGDWESLLADRAALMRFYSEGVYLCEL